MPLNSGVLLPGLGYTMVPLLEGPYLSCGRAQAAAPPPSPSGTGGTRPAHTPAESG